MKELRKRLESPEHCTLDQMPSAFLYSVLATEDANFFSHRGFDWFAIRQALKDGFHTGKFRGASTISQQVVKNFFVGSDRTIVRKLREAFLTWRLERSFSKKEILELYLNRIEWAHNVYGIVAAARHYFKKHPSELTPAECVFLGSITMEPRYHELAFFGRNLSQERMEHIIHNMYVISFLRETHPERSFGLPEIPYSQLTKFFLSQYSTKDETIRKTHLDRVRAEFMPFFEKYLVKPAKVANEPS